MLNGCNAKWLLGESEEKKNQFVRLVRCEGGERVAQSCSCYVPISTPGSLWWWPVQGLSVTKSRWFLSPGAHTGPWQRSAPVPLLRQGCCSVLHRKEAEASRGLQQLEAYCLLQSKDSGYSLSPHSVSLSPGFASLSAHSCCWHFNSSSCAMTVFSLLFYNFSPYPFPFFLVSIYIIPQPFHFFLLFCQF